MTPRVFHDNAIIIIIISVEFMIIEYNLPGVFFRTDLLCIPGQYEYAATCLPTHILNTPTASDCTIYIHTGQCAASVTVNTASSTETITLQSNEVHKVDFNASMFPVNGSESKAIRIESSAKVQVLVSKNADQFSDVYEVPHSDSNALQFVTSGYNKGHCISPFLANQFYIVTTVYDDTTITIQPENDTSFHVVLPSFGTFTTVSFDETNFIASGTLIMSNAPITVISGVLCEWNPDGTYSGQDGSYISSIPPISNLADQYVIPSLRSQDPASPGFSLQVVATDSNTTVEFDGNVVELDSLGNSATFELDNRTDWMSLDCSKHCLVAQYTKPLGAGHRYGMFMLSLLGANEFYLSSTFTTLDIQGSQSYISIVVEGKAPGTGILLNGDSLGDLDWGTIDNYATAIDQGTYVMESVNSRPFVVYVYSQWLIDCPFPGCPDLAVGAGYTRY